MMNPTFTVRKRYCGIGALLFALLFACPGSAEEPLTGEALARALRDNVVHIRADWGGGHQGFGFIVGERTQFLYIVTADHVVRGDEPGEEDVEPTVVFHYDQGVRYEAELLETRLPRSQGDLALLRVRKPAGTSWQKSRSQFAPSRPRHRGVVCRPVRPLVRADSRRRDQPVDGETTHHCRRIKSSARHLWCPVDRR